MEREYYVYILASHRRALYIGVTNDIERRLLEHRTGVGSSHALRYNAMYLVHLEIADDPYSAISREKQLKKWTRAKKIALIESANPTWRDLSLEYF